MAGRRACCPCVACTQLGDPPTPTRMRSPPRRCCTPSSTACRAWSPPLSTATSGTASAARWAASGALQWRGCWQHRGDRLAAALDPGYTTPTPHPPCRPTTDPGVPWHHPVGGGVAGAGPGPVRPAAAGAGGAARRLLAAWGARVGGAPLPPLLRCRCYWCGCWPGQARLSTHRVLLLSTLLSATQPPVAAQPPPRTHPPPCRRTHPPSSTPPSTQVLDEFEGDEYRKEPVRARLLPATAAAQQPPAAQPGSSGVIEPSSCQQGGGAGCSGCEGGGEVDTVSPRALAACGGRSAWRARVWAHMGTACTWPLAQQEPICTPLAAARLSTSGRTPCTPTCTGSGTRRRSGGGRGGRRGGVGSLAARRLARDGDGPASAPCCVCCLQRAAAACPHPT